MDFRIQQFIHDSKGELGVSINETNNSLTVFPIWNTPANEKHERNYGELLKSLVKLAYDGEVKIDYGCCGAHDFWDVYIGETKVAESHEYLEFTLFILPQCKYYEQLLKDIKKPIYQNIFHFYSYSLVGAFFYRYFKDVYSFASSIFMTDQEYIKELVEKNRALSRNESLFHRAIRENLLDVIRSVEVKHDKGYVIPNWFVDLTEEEFKKDQKEYEIYLNYTYDEYKQIYEKIQKLKEEILERYNYLDEEHVKSYINAYI